ncbi:bifunctional 2-polyprenyl-6-hydroxyphenol methylase/3-demethylubiquinol 3-O-methyltransferase UbiG [Bradyrhizobium liaoningense]|uniref:class I SAM-dependent methyltransferase n=1 Tax=Bradyrhizobium liaoningense TaxID=43992 RepID=UPI001BAB343E|nr:class I SAM-dependent methyltransferase [Bradyrhizobium liaoningense]MBR0713076.1 class I SAM-dependent methyltransferase [Bradyrhizobium liaoningense]
MSLRDREAHFEFGANWRDYAKTIDQARIDLAIAGLEKLFPEGVAGKTVLDIGCGSGMHALAALLLGAASVLAIDLDENSVSTTRELLKRYAPDKKWDTKICSVFDTSSDATGTFEIVYSWGVLHHTGDMWQAIEKAAALVRPGGQFALAIYAKTPLDFAWKIEKRLYASSPAAIQWMFRQLFFAVLMAGRALRGKNPLAVFRDPLTRGMNLSHDVHDWLGGYPYETASAEELDSRITGLGFAELRSFRLPDAIGLLGTGCHEFVFERLVA